MVGISSIAAVNRQQDLANLPDHHQHNFAAERAGRVQSGVSGLGVGWDDLLVAFWACCYIVIVFGYW